MPMVCAQHATTAAAAAAASPRKKKRCVDPQQTEATTCSSGSSNQPALSLSNKPPPSPALSSDSQPSTALLSSSKGGCRRLCHPFGVKPFGNSFEDQAKGIVPCRTRGLGLLQFFTDDQMLGLLGYLTAQDLVTLSGTSHALYVFANHDELWRALVLETFGGDFDAKHSWKQTFQAKIRPKALHAPPTPLPIPVQGFYSDLLFQPFHCATVEIQPRWLNKHTIARQSAKELTRDGFRTQFELPNVPVIITDCITEWPAMRKWTDEYLIQQCAGKPLIAGGFGMTMDRYLHYSRTLVDDQPLFIFDKDFATKVPPLAADYHVPEYFAQDFFGLLDPTQRPDHRWLIIGPKRSGSSFHIDPNATNAWNAVVRGAKKWIMFPPDVVPPGVHPSQDGAEVSTPVSLMEWMVTFYAQARRLPPHQLPLEGIVHAGEVIFVPHGWWHMVLNTDDCVAVTQNFVSEGNVAHVLQFLRDKPEQVSGCATHLRPKLYHLLRDALQQHEPALLQRVEQEEQAEIARKEAAAAAKHSLKWTQLVPQPKCRDNNQDDPCHDVAPSCGGGGFTFGFAL